MRTLLLLAVILAGCTAAAPVPYVPLAQNGRYGFAERQLAPAEFEVRYLSPTRLGFGGPSRGAADATVDKSYDFALRRAAEVAIAGGFQGFTILDSRVDVRTYTDRGWARPFGFGGFGSRSGLGLGVGSSFGADDQSALQADIVLHVRLANAGERRYYDANSVLEQVRRNYPDA